MYRLWIKICGLRTREAVEAAATAGADAVGFVFHAASPRNLTLRAGARPCRRAVPAGVERVAVFLHPAQALVDAVHRSRCARTGCRRTSQDLAALRLPRGQRVLPVRAQRRGARRVRCRRACLFEGARSGAGEQADWRAAPRGSRDEPSSCWPAGSTPATSPRRCAPCVRSAWT